MLYRIVDLVLKIFLLFVFRIKIVGKENVPMEGGAIFAMNHRSNWDVVVSSVASPRKLRFMAKSEMFKSKLAAYFLNALGAFPVHRGKGDIGAIKSALGRLKENHIVAMFPEGRRVRDGESQRAKPGVVMLAVRAGVPVIPVHISGRYRWMGKITVNIGEPIYFNEYYGEKVVVETLQELTDSMMRTIAAL